MEPERWICNSNVHIKSRLAYTVKCLDGNVVRLHKCQVNIVIGCCYVASYVPEITSTNIPMTSYTSILTKTVKGHFILTISIDMIALTWIPIFYSISCHVVLLHSPCLLLQPCLLSQYILAKRACLVGRVYLYILSFFLFLAHTYIWWFASL